MAERCYGCMQIKENQTVCEHCGYDGRSGAKSHQLPPGTLVGGQYTLGKVLGQGGFGVTYIGWDNVLNQRVAVKEYFPTGYAGRDTRITLDVTSYDDHKTQSFENNKKRFLREAESLAKLWDISQIVRILRHFEENGTAYIAMEYVEGEDLRKYLKNLGRPMTMEELMEILGPIMDALTLVHEADLVHRDISPDNIMVLPDGTGKLLDFGAARFVENADAEADRNTSTQAILKHGFAPPEQYRSHGALGPWTDIYAMCATVYFCLTGRIPPESMSRMMGEAELDLDSIPGLTRQQKAALEEGMALKPKERIKTAGQLRQKLFEEILAARERARLEAEAEKQRQEEALRKERERQEAELRRQEEQRRKEQERKEAELRRQEEQRRKEHERKEAELRRQEEERKKEQARKEAALKKQKEREEAERQKQEAAREKERLRKEALQRRKEQDLEKKKKADSGKEKRSPFPKWIPAAAAVLVLAIGIFVFGNDKPSAEAPAVSEVVGVESVAATVPANAENQILLEIAPEVELEMDALGQTVSIPVLSEAPGQTWWDSSDPQVVTVSEDGTVTAVGYGTALVTVSSGDQSDSCQVIVYPKANVTCTYEKNPNGLTITGIEGQMPAELILPRYIDGKPVTAIGRFAFSGHEEITSVVIPYGVTRLEEGALCWCKNLENVIIPQTVTHIEKYFFEETKWKRDQTDAFVICGDGILVAYNGSESEVNIPDTVKQIGPAAFEDCTFIRKVAIPETVTSINQEAFSGCTNLSEVVIPESVTAIDGLAFQDTPWLKAQQEEFVVVGDGVLLKYNGKDRHVTIPSYVKMVSSAFYQCMDMAEVTIPDTVTAFGTFAFGNCFQLQKVNMGNGLIKIGAHAFDTCSRLKQITIPESVTTLGRSAFVQCYELQTVSGGENLREISDFAFQLCYALTSIDIGENVERIGYYAFHECKQLRDLKIPDGCTVAAEAFG